MKARFCDIANRFDIHPANLLLHLQAIGASFDQCWPSLDESWVETLAQMDPQVFGAKIRAEKSRASVSEKEELSNTAARLVDKLYRHNRWGKAGVPFDILKKVFRRESENIRDAINELIERGFIISPSKNGPYSLNPDVRSEIDSFVRTIRTTK